MKILFSPSEKKKIGGIEGKIDSKSFIFPELFNFRKKVIDKYIDFVNSASDERLTHFFGIKDPKDFQKYKNDLYKAPLMKAIERYDGVAFNYLNYQTLDRDSQKYIDENLIIFSNLFGPVRAGDFGLPNYKLKQGEKIGDFVIETFYEEHFSKALDEFLDEPFLDLRANFYNRFYKPKIDYITLKFLKNSKVVSHWAKAYRGLILRAVAQNKIKSIEEFMNIQIENLTIKEIVKRGKNSQIVFEIKS